MAQIRIVYNLIRPIARKSGRENQSIRLKKGEGGGGGGGGKYEERGLLLRHMKSKGCCLMQNFQSTITGGGRTQAPNRED